MSLNPGPARNHPSQRLVFVGAGRVGQALAWHCRRLGYRVAGPCRVPSAGIERGDVLFITTPDSAIEQVYRELRPRLRARAVVAHCAGRFGVEVFADAGQRRLDTLAFHPMQVFPDPVSARRGLVGSGFAIDGTPAGLRFGRTLARKLRGFAFRVRGPDRPLYHTLCVFASNLLMPALPGVETLAPMLGLAGRRGRAALARLSHGALAAALEHGAAASLTGPIQRGDVAALRSHLSVLAQRSPELIPLYKRLSEPLVDMARHRGLPDSTLKQLRATLGRK
jgi:predicted short-subunit dehydrogenase-like oxidoreductase (DUF2520 family)